MSRGLGDERNGQSGQIDNTMTANFAHTLSYELSLPRSLHHRYELRNFSFLQTYYVLQLRLILRGRVTGFHYVSMYADFSAPPAPFVCKFTQPRLKHYVRIWAYTSPSARTYVVNGSPIQLGDKCRGTGCVYSAPREQTENTTRDLRGSRVDAAKIDLLAVKLPVPPSIAPISPTFSRNVASGQRSVML